jgi:hypothetical protein
MTPLILVLTPPSLVPPLTFLVLWRTFILVPLIFTPFDLSLWMVYIFLIIVKFLQMILTGTGIG